MTYAFWDAEELLISKATVESYGRHILAKLQLQVPHNLLIEPRYVGYVAGPARKPKLPRRRPDEARRYTLITLETGGYNPVIIDLEPFCEVSWDRSGRALIRPSSRPIRNRHNVVREVLSQPVPTMALRHTAQIGLLRRALLSLTCRWSDGQVGESRGHNTPPGSCCVDSLNSPLDPGKS